MFDQPQRNSEANRENSDFGGQLLPKELSQNWRQNFRVYIVFLSLKNSKLRVRDQSAKLTRRHPHKRIAGFAVHNQCGSRYIFGQLCWNRTILVKNLSVVIGQGRCEGYKSLPSRRKTHSFNLFNRTNMAPPGWSVNATTNLLSPGNQNVTSGTFGYSNQAFDMRILQLALKFYF